ncbi:TRAP transporter large permease [Salinisphaera aquimarina]|uniref:TRAP transporter large permease protein n=1 Tax=Salinisphaera aquimarina TaxID=2094031 RepID=A0ABV7EMG4_9GAMM
MILIVLLMLVALIALGFPIAIALLVSSIFYFFMQDVPGMLIVQQMMTGAPSFVLVAIPLFILAGQLMNNGGITRRIIRFCNALLGRAKGGLAQVNILSSMIFAGISGEAVADTAGLGGVLIPAMKKHGYSAEDAGAITAAASVAGPIIPPSIPMIICASLAQVSVGQMFLGGALPGLLFIVMAMVFTYFIADRAGFPRGEKSNWSELYHAFIDAFWALMAPVIIVGGLITGIVTVTEAAVIAVLYVFIIGQFVYREIDLRQVVSELWYTAALSGAIMFILASAKVYTYALTREQIAHVLTQSLDIFISSPNLLFIVIILIALVIGAILSTTAGLLLMVPLLAPLVDASGIDPIHFYVLVTIALCIGTLTPPVGINLYLAASIAEAPPQRVFLRALPYLLLLLAIIGLGIFVPSLVLALPHLVYGG